MTLARCFILLSLLLASVAGAATRPHIVMFLSDDHSAEFTGCYGHQAIHTPNIDALATQGMRFTNVFAGSPTCAPSRSILYTGLHSFRNGAMGNHTQCKPGLKSLPHYLSSLGYRVVLANKSHVGPKEVFPFEMLQATLPKDPAIARRYRMEGLDTKKVDAFLAGHVAEHPEQPLCLVLAESGPHVVWEKNKTYDPATLPLPPVMVDTPITREAFANYFQDITTVDKRVGEVLASLKAHGMEPNTLFIYTSDQGAEWPHCKWTVYDTGLRAPFIVRWPGQVKPGSTSDALISFTDVLPTFIDVAGGKVPAGIDGSSFLDVILGRHDKHQDHIFATHTRDGDMNVFPQRCVRDTRFKLVLNLLPENRWTTHFTKVMDVPGSHGQVYATWLEKTKTDPDAAKLVATIENHPRWEFYDTDSDPYELTNLAADPNHVARIAALKSRLVSWLQQQGDAEALAAVEK